MFLTAAPHGMPGVDLMSIRPYKIRRTYRFSPEKSSSDNDLRLLDSYCGLVIATAIGGSNPTYNLAWDIETGRLVSQMSLIPPYRREDCWGPFLNEHILHYENILLEVPSFRPVHTFEANDIMGIAGDQVVTAKSDTALDTIFTIYQLSEFRKVREVTIEGYSWLPELNSRKYVLLVKNSDKMDFILIDLEDFCRKYSGANTYSHPSPVRL